MKIFSFLIILLLIFILGWIYASKNTNFLPENESDVFTGTRLLPTMKNGSGLIIETPTGLVNLQTKEERIGQFREFILNQEKVLFSSGGTLNKNSFTKYISSLLAYTIDYPGFRELITLPYDDTNLSIDHIIQHIFFNKAKDDGTTAQIIAGIYSFDTPPKKYSQKECFDFLNSQNDFGEFFKDLSQITFSGYISSPLFQRDFTDVTLDDLYTPEGINGKGSDDKDWRDIEARVNLLLISDFLFFQRSESMTLDGIANSLQCELSAQKDQEMCFALEKALRNKDKEFILKKFANNPRKYDLDSYYIRYLIGDLDKTGFINKVCLIK